MNTELPDGGPRPGWFVGASYGGTEDQTLRFLRDGIWENGYDDRYLDQVRAMRAGDRIAIKATYVRKQGLPFDNRGESVSVMAIRATGTIEENLNDGKRVRVDWTVREDPPREWYFYTYRQTIWRVMPGEWMRDGLLAFAFDGRLQDIDRFLKHPNWRERYGSAAGDPRFRWTEFHAAEAERARGPDDPAPTANEEGEVTDENDSVADITPPPPPIEPYSIDDVLADGCFLERGEIERLLERLRTRKNLILQGPPGTGKTWIARRLAFALMGEKDEGKVRTVQFHPNLSYEDFVRGWRPAGDGRLELADGVFMEAIRMASGNPATKFVVVIEEINRGNPAQIFGELLTLLEAGKRTPGEAIELCYPDSDGGRRPVHVPENLHVIGTMNIADRSLALVDLAFRRRFAFVTLEPKLGKAWRDWVIREGGIDPERVEDIERGINELNERIARDPSLGSQFRIGHSYVTPTHRVEDGATRDWFRQVAETEIGPLLEEYWFDSPDEADKAVGRLLAGW